MTAVTAPLRREHAMLLPRLGELDDIAAQLSHWDSTTSARLHETVAFLRDHLVPHAQAEEAALYPRVEEAMHAPGATDTMKADHREIVQRIDILDATATELRDSASDEQVEQLRAQLYGLSAILLLHFRKEEDVLLPVLDAALTPEQADVLFADMAAVAHPETVHRP